MIKTPVTVDSLSELKSLNRKTNFSAKTAIVEDNVEGGIFKYTPSKFTINDGKDIINGWVRQDSVGDITVSAILEATTKTVGAGKDFETLHLALRWAETVSTVGGASITFQLDPGVHVLGGQGEFNENNWNYYSLSNINLTIQGDDNVYAAPDTRADFIITLDSYDDGDNWPNIIDFYGNSSFTITGITVDMSYNGYPYSGNTFPINSFNDDNISARFSDIKNSYYGINMSQGFLNLRDTNITNCYYGVNISSSKIIALNASFSNCVICIYAERIDGKAQNLTFLDSNRGLEMVDGSFMNCTNLTCSNLKLNAYPVGIRYQSAMMFFGVLSIDSINKASYGINVDEDSRLFFDNTTTNSITINNAVTGIVSDGAYVGVEFDIATTITNCDFGFRVAHGGEIYLRNIVPTFTNVTTPYSIERNILKKEGIIKSDTLPYLTSLYDNTNSGLTAITEKTAIDELSINKADIAYLFSAEFGAAFPTADPLVAGKIWNNAGVLTVSAG